MSGSSSQNRPKVSSTETMPAVPKKTVVATKPADATANYRRTLDAVTPQGYPPRSAVTAAAKPPSQTTAASATPRTTAASAKSSPTAAAKPQPQTAAVAAKPQPQTAAVSATPRTTAAASAKSSPTAAASAKPPQAAAASATPPRTTAVAAKPQIATPPQQAAAPPPKTAAPATSRAPPPAKKIYSYEDIKTMITQEEIHRGKPIAQDPTSQQVFIESITKMATKEASFKQQLAKQREEVNNKALNSRSGAVTHHQTTYIPGTNLLVVHTSNPAQFEHINTFAKNDPQWLANTSKILPLIQGQVIFNPEATLLYTHIEHAPPSYAQKNHFGAPYCVGCFPLAYACDPDQLHQCSICRQFMEASQIALHISVDSVFYGREYCVKCVQCKQYFNLLVSSFFPFIPIILFLPLFLYIYLY